MTEEEPDRNGIRGILPFVLEDEREKFKTYVRELIDGPASGDLDGSFLGFIEDYINYAELLKRKVIVREMAFWDKPKSPLVVYDVGCAYALQHVVFDTRIHYVGIDPGWNREGPKFFRPNCTFVRGYFEEVVHDLKIDRENSIGIANMSLLYGGSAEALRLFDQTFKRKFIL